MMTSRKGFNASGVFKRFARAFRLANFEFLSLEGVLTYADWR